MIFKLLKEMEESSHSQRIVSLVKSKITVAEAQTQVPLNEDEAVFLLEVWKELRSHPRVLEVGLGWGFSASCLLAAGSVDHTIVSFEPDAQGTTRESIALHNVYQFGRPRVIFGPSDRVLPRLLDQGERFGLVLIDGNHLFDFTLVDAFYAVKLLVVGGFFMLDDTGYPQVQAVCDFIEKNYAHVSLVARPPNAALFQK
ncbi:MAG: O-methyltransferase, partial [Betaproteobacteria bacterium]